MTNGIQTQAPKALFSNTFLHLHLHFLFSLIQLFGYWSFSMDVGSMTPFGPYLKISKQTLKQKSDKDKIQTQVPYNPCYTYVHVLPLFLLVTGLALIA